MSRSWVRRVLVAAAAGAMAVAALTLAGVTGTASAAVPTAALTSDVTTMPAAIGSLVRPASAAVGAAGDQGEFKIFGAANFQGGFANVANSTIPDLTPFNLNDKITSAVNNSNIKMCLFTDANFQGQRTEFPPNTQIQQLSAAADNQVSSLKPC
jgi:hypothetical protein